MACLLGLDGLLVGGPVVRGKAQVCLSVVVGGVLAGELVWGKAQAWAVQGM